MNLGIQIAGEFVDLAPDALMDMEQENPFLQFINEIIGEYSLPFEVLATPKNLRLLNFSGIMEMRVSNAGIDAIVFDNGIPFIHGKVKIEKPTVNLNSINEGRISCYFLSGASSFYQDIKDKRLRDIDAGGERSIDWDGYSTTGFWGHVWDVMNASPGYGVSGYDYAFFPVKNESWPGSGDGPDIMNKVSVSGGGFGIDQFLGSSGSFGDPNRLVPFPYLKYVMIQAAEYVGWKIQGEILGDADFKKAVLINFRAIDWVWLRRNSGDWDYVPRDPVEFDIADHLPDKTIAEFFIALKNRIGWWYDFDRASKTIYIKELQVVAAGEVKDFTLKASPVIPKQINQQTKIYALRNQFSGSAGDGAPNFNTANLIGSVDELTDLPAAAEAKYGHVYLVIAENNFYICQQNVDTEVWEWIIYAANIYDYEPDGFTEEVRTAATTIGVEKYNDGLDLIPRADKHGVWAGWPGYETIEDDWGIILCFNHGVRNNKNGDPYPYGSSHIYDSEFIQVADWALTFECKTAGGLEDVGLYERNWRRLFDLLKSQEEADVKLFLNRVEYTKLSFSDQIVIRNVRFFIKTKKPRIPFNGEMDLRVVRI